MKLINDTAPGDTLVVLPPIADLRVLTDAELQDRVRAYAAIHREVNARLARGAGELARRSSRLAAREGARSPELLIERLAGVTPAEAHALVRIGGLFDASLDGVSGGGHADVVAESIAAGAISVLAADAVLTGLGEPTATVTAHDLAAAAQIMVERAPEIPIRRVAAEARSLRDDLDSSGIAEREAMMRERRFLRLSPQPDGMTRVSGLLDPESAAIVVSAFDEVTAPRRGGPRFVDVAEKARAQRVIDDPRSTDQLMADTFVELIRIAGGADQNVGYGQRTPAVQIHVDAAGLHSGVGTATFEGQSVAVSVETARRFVCSAGQIGVLFTGADPIDVSPEARFFTRRQRRALAARDGGCRYPGCDRPPSWTEAHHVNRYGRGGPTTVENGILLCRFHHMAIHNQGFQVIRRGSRYFLIPPSESGRVEQEMPAHHVHPGGMIAAERA
ncbi:HNH endonuclease signature motif containing protein [soil metagenome]